MGGITEPNTEGGKNLRQVPLALHIGAQAYEFCRWRFEGLRIGVRCWEKPGGRRFPIASVFNFRQVKIFKLRGARDERF